MPISEQDVEQELSQLKARLRGMGSKPPADLTPLQKAIAGVNANWHLSSKFPAPVNAPLPWRAAYFAKRVVRRVMVELLNSVVEQQNAFNAQAARALTELAKENAEMKARMEEMEKQKNA